MDAVYEAIRSACSDDSWSVGVRLARSGAVLIESRADNEIVARVRTLKSLAAPKVTLFLDDLEWVCDCGSRAPACEHVAATVIAVKLGAAEPSATAAEPGPAHLAYRLWRRGDGLVFERGVAAEDRFHVIEIGLEAARAARSSVPAFVATRADLEVDVVLGAGRRGPVPAASAAKLLAALARCSDVRLDDRPIRVSTQPVTPVVVVEDAGEGYRLRLTDPPGVAERFVNGLARVGDELRPLREPHLTAREFEEFRDGRLFGAADVAELVSRVLPSLRGRVPVDVRTARLPQAVREPPRVSLEVSTTGSRNDVLVALATVVYGVPPRARVDGGRMVALGEPVPIRDEPAERNVARRLARELDLAPGVAVHFEGDAAASFARRLERWGGEITGEGLRRFALAPTLDPRVRARADGELDLEFVPAAGPAARRSRGPSTFDVLAAWRRGDSGIVLPEGGWAPLPTDFLSKHGRLVADLLASREAAGGRLPRAALPDLARLCDVLDHPPPPALDGLRALVTEFAGLPEAELPVGLRAVLRGYQCRGADWLAFLRDAGLGGLLADDMGLGKTVQALTAVRGRTLVVCPTSVLANWEEEARKFRPDLTVRRYHGPGRSLDPHAELTVTSYALLRLDAEELSEVDWDTVILDEAQAIKNPDSQVARAAFGLPGRFRVALTGTPVENRLDEMWSVMQFANPGLLGGLSDFTERCARPIADGDTDAADRLRARIRPFVLRRLKREVAPELPPRIEVVLHNELTDDERAVYDAVRAATREEVVRRLAAGGSVFAALEALLRLRQAACHAGLLPGRDDPTSSKVELLTDTLATVSAEGHRALVFSQWTALLDRIEPHLVRQGLPYARLDGSTVDRAAVVGRFQDADGPPVLLVSLRAGGTGLNLTAADHVFLVDPWWNPAVEAQAADRAHRIGQERPVVVHRIVSVDTVEERILALQERKRALADAVVTPEAAAGLTREDLMALLA